MDEELDALVEAELAAYEKEHGDEVLESDSDEGDIPSVEEMLAALEEEESTVWKGVHPGRDNRVDAMIEELDTLLGSRSATIRKTHSILEEVHNEVRNIDKEEEGSTLQVEVEHELNDEVVEEVGNEGVEEQKVDQTESDNIEEETVSKDIEEGAMNEKEEVISEVEELNASDHVVSLDSPSENVNRKEEEEVVVREEHVFVEKDDVSHELEWLRKSMAEQEEILRDIRLRREERERRKKKREMERMAKDEVERVDALEREKRRKMKLWKLKETVERGEMVLEDELSKKVRHDEEEIARVAAEAERERLAEKARIAAEVERMEQQKLAELEMEKRMMEALAEEQRIIRSSLQIVLEKHVFPEILEEGICIQAEREVHDALERIYQSRASNVDEKEVVGEEEMVESEELRLSGDKENIISKDSALDRNSSSLIDEDDKVNTASDQVVDASLINDKESVVLVDEPDSRKLDHEENLLSSNAVQIGEIVIGEIDTKHDENVVDEQGRTSDGSPRPKVLEEDEFWTRMLSESHGFLRCDWLPCRSSSVSYRPKPMVSKRKEIQRRQREIDSAETWAIHLFLRAVYEQNPLVDLLESEEEWRNKGYSSTKGITPMDDKDVFQAVKCEPSIHVGEYVVNEGALDLSVESLEEIPSSLGEAMRSTTVFSLSLNVNKIKYLPLFMTSGIKSLRGLYVRDNALESSTFAIHEDSARTLEILDLSMNKLDSLPKTVPTMPKLHTLRLHNNMLSDISILSSMCPSCTELSLYRNQLTQKSLHPLGNALPNIRHLDVGRNQLSGEKFPMALLEGHPFLTELDAYESSISALPSFFPTVFLRILYVNGNLIEHLPVLRHLPFLSQLYLQDNRIKTISHRAVAACASLQVLDLSFNHVEDIREVLHLLPVPTSLMTLRLNDNPVVGHPAFSTVISLFPWQSPGSSRAALVRRFYEEAKGQFKKNSMRGHEHIAGYRATCVKQRIEQELMEREYRRCVRAAETSGKIGCMEHLSRLSTLNKDAHSMLFRHFMLQCEKDPVVGIATEVQPQGYVLTRNRWESRNRRNKAVLTIQRVVRGMLCRHGENGKQLKAYSQKRNSAAYVIQAMWKGHRVRIILDETRRRLREEMDDDFEYEEIDMDSFLPHVEPENLFERPPFASVTQLHSNSGDDMNEMSDEEEDLGEVEDDVIVQDMEDSEFDESELSVDRTVDSNASLQTYKQDIDDVAEEWGLQNEVVAAAVLRKRRDYRRMIARRERREYMKDPSHRLEAFKAQKAKETLSQTRSTQRRRRGRQRKWL